jgi:hypothetical protein
MINYASFSDEFYSYPFFSRGMTETDKKSNRKKLLSSCLDILSQNMSVPPNKLMTIDCDAFSFVIVSVSMDYEIKETIKNFLLHFGTVMSSITIPIVAIASNKKESIFGGSRNKSGSQHLKSHTTGTKLMSGESQVITAPVKIAVHNSCRKSIVSHLNKFPSQYPMHISTNRDICFDASTAANTPPYGVIVEAILDNCFITDIGKHVIHVADIGKRHNIHCHDSGGFCHIASMFEKVKKMRQITGVTVEMTQLDIAFNIPSEKNALIQCSYEKVKHDENKIKSSLESMIPETWPLHTIRMKDDNVDSRQVGTARLKQKNWDKPKITSFLLNKNRYNDSHCSEKTNSSESEYSCEDDDENIILEDVYKASTQDHMDIDMKSIYSVKFYSTIAHFVTQKRSQLPLTYVSMDQLPKSTMVSLQRLLSLFLKISDGAMNYVKQNGICARLEISVRPSSSHHVGEVLRCQGHLIDILAHVQITIHELFLSKKHMLSFATISYEPVYRKILLLIDQLQSMTRLRASVRFCDIYHGERSANWLRAIVTVIMTYTGLAGEHKLKFFKKWVNDANRFTPNDMSPHTITDLHSNLDSYRPPILRPTIIPAKIWALLKKSLSSFHLSDRAIASIIYVLKHNKPISHSRKMMVDTSLQDKWNFATNIRKHVIPVLSIYFQKDNDFTGKKGPAPIVAQSLPTVWSERDNFHNILSNCSSPETFFPQELVYPTLALNQFSLNSAIFTQPKLLDTSTQDPLMLVITRLSNLSALFDVHTPVFLHYLYRYINLCHTSTIKLPNVSENLVALQCSDDHSYEFNYASQCISEKRCDHVSLAMICTGLDVEILDSHNASTEERYLASLCHHYYFPCQLLSTAPNISSIPSTDQDILNALYLKTFESEIVFEMKSHLSNRKHYYRFQEDVHLWIHVKELVISSQVNVDVDNMKIIDMSPDLYIILDKCFNKLATHGVQMRINLHHFLFSMNPGFLCNSFLLDDGSNNPDFFPCYTVQDLLIHRNILFLEDEGTPLDLSNYSNMSCEVILPCTALLYQENIFLIDKVKNQSHLHIYDQRSSKVFTYTYPNTFCSPVSMLKCKIFLKDTNNVFSIIQLEPKLLVDFSTSQAPLQVPSPYFMQYATKIKSLAKHPQGRVTKCRSFVDSMLKLLCSENVKHPHFFCIDKQYKSKEHDPLDILDYVNEFIASFSSLSIYNFLDQTIIDLMEISEPMPVSSWMNAIVSEYSKLPHTQICPVLCLKYKIWIAVWEDQVLKDGKSLKASYFYWFDNIRGIVSCHIQKGCYIHLPSQSHIFYLKCSKGSNFGYWKQDPLNPFINSNISFNDSNLLECKLSYLDDRLRMKIFHLFKDHFSMNVFSIEDYCNPKFHDSNKPTLVPLEISNNDGNIIQQALMIIYPFDNDKDKYFGVIIHTEVSTALLKKSTQDFLTKTRNCEVIYNYVIDELSLHHLSDFGTTFFLIIHMYIAHTSQNMNDLRLKLAKLVIEPDKVQKSKCWISTLISNSSSENIPFVPQWLHQISSNNPNPINTSNNPSIDNKEHKTNNCSPRLFHTLKRRQDVTLQQTLLPIKIPRSDVSQKNHSPTISSIKSNIMNNINTISDESSGIWSIFGHASQYDYSQSRQYIDQLERSFSDESCTISAMTEIRYVPPSFNDISSLIENDWITEVTVNFMAILINKKFEQISHIYTSDFMEAILTNNNNSRGNKFTHVQTWHKDINVSVNVLYIPIHRKCHYWMVSKLDFLRKTISIWNPSQNTEWNEAYLHNLKSYAEFVSDSLTSCHIPIETRWTTVNKQKWSGSWKIKDLSHQCPKVQRHDDSGVFTLLNMIILINGKLLSTDQYSQREIIQRRTRIRIATYLFQNRELGKNGTT